MAWEHLFVAAVGMMGVASAGPMGLHMDKRQEVPVSTITVYPGQHTVAPAIPVDESPSEALGSGFLNDTELPGIAYAPYRNDHSCKSKAQIDSDLSKLNGTFALVRIYGTDCDQVQLVHDAAKKYGFKLFLGIWSIDDVASEAQKIIQGIAGDWSSVKAVSVGNELVNSGQADPSSVLAAVGQARKLLQKAGYKGPVVTVDTFNAAQAHPELCGDEVDFCAVNAHSFFDPTVLAEQAGEWLQKTINDLKSKIPPGKHIVVTETGWPTRGDANGHAVPSIQNQKAAMDSIKKVFGKNPGNVIMFSAYNDGWKPLSSSTFNAEPYWGLDGANSVDQ